MTASPSIVSGGPDELMAPGDPTGACPKWPTMWSLTEASFELLVELRDRTWDLRANHAYSLNDLVTAALLEAPEAPEDLFGLVSPLMLTAPVPRQPIRRLMLEVPAPATFRLNVLIRRTREELGHRMGRSPVLASMLTELDRRHPDTPGLRQLVAQCMARPAQGVALGGVMQARALVLRRPRPGPRPTP